MKRKLASKAAKRVFVFLIDGLIVFAIWYLQYFIFDGLLSYQKIVTGEVLAHRIEKYPEENHYYILVGRIFYNADFWDVPYHYGDFGRPRWVLVPSLDPYPLGSTAYYKYRPQRAVGGSEGVPRLIPRNSPELQEN